MGTFSPGEDLNNHPHLEFFEGDTPEDIQKQLRQIKLPFKIISIYGLNGKHYAWANLTRPIKKFYKRG